MNNCYSSKDSILLAKFKEVQRAFVEEHLNMCTEEQIKFFHEKVFPKGINTDEQFINAIKIIERTIHNNKKGEN